jgi:hypothetical protein
MAAEWEAAINIGAQWIEIVTWNDGGESTYVASFGPPDATDLWGGGWGPLLSHGAYLAASAYYIRWFKTGIRMIDKDEFFWFYRLTPRSQEGHPTPRSVLLGYPYGAEKLEDHVFTSVFLTAPAHVIIVSGKRRYKFELLAGVHHLNVEFGEGAQEFSLVRAGRTVLVGHGQFPISRDNWSNFNYLSGSARPPTKHSR